MDLSQPLICGMNLQPVSDRGSYVLAKPPKGSSPWYQDKFGLNKDVTLKPKKSEGKKLRE